MPHKLQLARLVVPLAVVVRDRRLLAATLVVQALFIVHQMAPLLVPVQ